MLSFQALREQAGLSKRALARRWGCTRQAIQNFEAGRVKTPPPRWDDLVQLAQSGGSNAAASH